MAIKPNTSAASRAKTDRHIKVGIWVWGTATVLLALGFLLLVVLAGVHITPTTCDKYEIDAKWSLAGLFLSVKENGSLVAGILGFSGLAWSHFFKRNSAEN